MRKHKGTVANRPYKETKPLTALVGRLSLSVGWENRSERGANSSDPNQTPCYSAFDPGLHCLSIFQSRFYR